MRFTIIKCFFLSISLFSCSALLSQEGGFGNWIMYFGQNRIHDRWSVHTEIQYRNHDLLPNIEQLLVRTGLYYHLDGNTTLLAGYAYVPSYRLEDSFTDPVTTEHRIFQELQLNNRAGKIAFNHRYRIEERWVSEKTLVRFRYRLLAVIPLSNKTKDAPFLAFYDEVFLAPGARVFDRNRAYGALGYKFSSTASAQLGILNQQLPDRHKWYLQIGLFYNPDLR